MKLAAVSSRSAHFAASHRGCARHRSLVVALYLLLLALRSTSRSHKGHHSYRSLEWHHCEAISGILDGRLGMSSPRTRPEKARIQVSLVAAAMCFRASRDAWTAEELQVTFGLSVVGRPSRRTYLKYIRWPQGHNSSTHGPNTS